MEDNIMDSMINTLLKLENDLENIHMPLKYITYSHKLQVPILDKDSNEYQRFLNCQLKINYLKDFLHTDYGEKWLERYIEIKTHKFKKKKKMTSENYREILISEQYNKEMTRDEYEHTLKQFAMLYRQEQLNEATSEGCRLLAKKIILALDDYGRKTHSVKYGLPIDPDTKDFEDKRPKEMLKIVTTILNGC